MISESLAISCLTALMGSVVPFDSPAEYVNGPRKVSM